MQGILEGDRTRVSPLDPNAAIRDALRSAAGVGAATPDCLDDDTLAALADGTLDAARRDPVLTHVAGCARCRAAVASVARTLAAPGVAREVAALQHSGPRRFYRVLLPVAAAAVLLLVLGRPRPPEDRGHRGPSPGAGVPVPVAPVGVVAGASPLQWTAVAGADRYRITLSAASGAVLYEVQTGDTLADLPDSIRFVPGRSYVWLVEARTGFDRWVTSRLAEFTIGRARSP